MESQPKYQKGQRWEFQHDFPEFETTFVIGWVIEAHPEWGSDWEERRYEVYIRYNPSCGKWIPPGMDGVVLTLTGMKLDGCVTKLLESGVELPWWWKYGRPCESESDVPKATYGGADIKDLPILLRCAKEQKVNARMQEEALRKHREKFASSTKPKPSRSVAESWQRIESWYAENAYSLSNELGPGASAKAIEQFQQEIGAKLPEDFTESVQIHDGGGWWVPWRYGDLLSLHQILEQWKMYCDWQAKGEYATGGEDWMAEDIKGPIKPVFWNKKRIYVTDNSGNHLTLDLDPPPDGVYGQVVDHSHEVGPTEVVASGWGEFLRNLVEDLESGKYVYLEHVGDLELVEDLERKQG
jgi:cell wall assembly regulator SMI1